MGEREQNEGRFRQNRFKAFALALASLTLGLLAWAGLVLPGLCSGRLEVVLFYVPAFAIPGVLCGHVAIGLAKRLGRARATGAVGFGGLVIGYSSVLIVVAVLLPQILLRRGPDRERARRITCRNNLKQIGLALQYYAHDYDGWFPIGPPGTDSSYALGMLGYSPDPYILDPGLFLCPSSEDSVGAWRRIDGGRSDEHGGLRPSSTSYAYVPGLRADSQADLMVVFDKTVENHKEGRNILFIDGHVGYLREEEFQKRLIEQMEQVSVGRQDYAE